MKRLLSLLAASLFGLAGMISSVSAQQSWLVIAPMHDARLCFMMEALPDGTILTMGGQDINMNCLSTCELFDPKTGQWSYTGSTNVPHGRSASVVLSDGRVVVIGGQTSAAVTQTDAIEIYSVATKSWSNGGHLLLPRQNHTATYINDSTIVIAGGLTPQGITSECEVYNALTGSCRTIATLHQNRHDQDAIALSDGRVLVAGGRDGGAGSTYFSECEIYDPSLDTWTVISPMFQARIIGILAQFRDGSVLAAGGRNTPNSSAPGSELLDLTTLRWTQTNPLMQPCHWSANVMLPDSRYLITGGEIDGNWANVSGLENLTTPTCEWYDRNSQTWYYAPTLNVTRDKHRAIFVHQEASEGFPKDLVLVAGGLVGRFDSIRNSISSEVTNSVEVLDVGQDALAYYMAHQPLSASVSNSKSVSGLTVIYDDNLNPQLEYRSDLSTSLTVDVVNSRGTSVYHSSATLGAGTALLDLQRLHLLPGVYFVNASTDDKQTVLKFIVSH